MYERVQLTETVDKSAVLRAVTPGGHPLITAAWLIGIALLVLAPAAMVLGAETAAVLLALGAVVLLFGPYVAYLLSCRCEA